MKRMKIFSIFLAVIFAVTGSVLPVSASAEGLAIYHDRAFTITNYWHSGVMISDTPENGYAGSFTNVSGTSYSFSNSNYSVSHLSSASNSSNSGATVLLASFSSFLASKTFTGYYISVDIPTLEKRQVIAKTALRFHNYSITYSALNQIDYAPKNISYPGYYVEPTSITKLRCDGFVEYCYERNNVRVFGPSGDADEWNIYHNLTTSRTVHNTGSLSTLSPEIQARSMKNMLGDINADGTISVSDARLALRYSTQLETPNEYEAYVANVTGDSADISSEDARLILRAATGLEGEVSTIGIEGGYRFPNDALI